MLRAILVAMMLIVTAGFGLVAWLSLNPTPAPPIAQAEAPPPPAPVAVLVVSKALQAGSFIKLDDLAAAATAPSEVPDGARPDTIIARAELVGAMVRRTMLAQQPVLPQDVLRPAEGGFLAAVLAPDHRAVSVAVDPVSGAAGLIWPGDRVDLILTQTTEDPATPAGRRTFGETVLHDIRVIAVDQQLAHAAGSDASNASSRTITLEVLPAAAERVAVAVRLGKVALAVRAASTLHADPDSLVQGVAFRKAVLPPALKAVPTTWGQDVSPALNRPRGVNAGATVRVYQGASSDKEFKFE